MDLKDADIYNLYSSSDRFRLDKKMKLAWHKDVEKFL